jgi:hypothetical protein
MIPLFWLLRTPASQRLAEQDPDRQYETIICPADAGHQRPGRRTGSLSVIVHPSALRDFTWTWLSDTLISQKVVDPTVTFVDPTGLRITMRDGAWLKSEMAK